MKMTDAVKLAASNLLKNPVRTFLTILGLSVGVGAILTVLTLGGAGQAQVELEIARMGVDKVWITADADSDRLMTEGDSALVSLHADAPACAGATTVCSIAVGDVLLTGQVSGYDAGLETVHQLTLTDGRLFTAAEHEEGAAVALVDESMAAALGGEVCGRRIHIGHRAAVVVGVIRDMTVQVVASSSGTVILPLRTFLDTFATAQVSELTVSVPGGRTAEEVGMQATAAMAMAGGQFRASSLQEEIDAAKSVIRIFVMVLACVAAVCMLTGSIGVMNILLVSVRERRREIGLMKAIGGTSQQVGTLFLMEAVCYAALGCAFGVVLGVVMIRLFGAWIGLSAALEASTAALAVLAACALGVLFGVVPALRAAGMVPVEALKSE